MPDSLPSAKTRRFGAYELLAKVGRGGMSTVFKARDTRTDAIVAVKVASRAVTDNALASKRFALESRVAQSLSHPHLVQVIDHGTVEGVPFMAMEFMAGGNLHDRLKNEGPLKEPTALATFLPLIDALTHLHGRQIIHRDIKPANIMFDARGVVKLTDFGLSKDLDSRSGMTRSRMGLGTIQFAAPEQFDDARSADPRSDVYSLALTLYVALTGELPFGTGSPVSVLRKKLQNVFEAPIVKNPKLHRWVNTAICKAMDGDRNRRPASCQEFAALLTTDFGSPDLTKTTLRPARLTGRERRGKPRYNAGMESICRPVNAPQQQRWPVMIKDISHSGVCLRIKRRFEIGNLLDLLFVMDRDGSTTSQLVRVRRVLGCEENTWQLGCEFLTPIDQYDLESFLNDRMQVTAMV